MRLAFALVCLAGCDVDLERMIEQPKYTPYEACEACPDGTIMMRPPQGTVARDDEIGSSELMRGRTETGYVAHIPIAVDRELLARGKNRFDIYCAACHGRLGNSLSQVAENMTLRRPPNLLAPTYVAYPPGRIFAVIGEGFGFMRSYAADLPVRDRWAVTAYLQALQLAQHVALRDLPVQLQEEARRWLK